MIAVSEQHNKQEILTKKEFIASVIDDIMLMIEDNIDYEQIAKKYNLSKSYLCEILNSVEHRERKEIALEIASDKQVEIARSHLESIKEDDTNASVRKKSELSQFELYLAKVKCRKKYDLNYREEKNDINNNIITPQLTLKIVNNSDTKLKINEDN